MTIKTLEYIHKLLQQEEARYRRLYDGARKLQHDYEESEPIDKELVKDQTEAADRYMREHLAAVDALQEFEQQEW